MKIFETDMKMEILIGAPPSFKSPEACHQKLGKHHRRSTASIGFFDISAHEYKLYVSN